MQAALRHERADQEAEISLVLCDDAFIRRLNIQHRGVMKATDVLSFAQDDPQVLGDIVISLETALRQAAAAEWPVESEIALLAVHGLLHLLGYEDESAEGAALMRDLAAECLTSSGIRLPDEAKHPFFVRYEEYEDEECSPESESP
jgi:probable rRNA maturation factor